MGKIPVIPAGDGKHPKEVEGDGDDERGPAPSYPDHTEAHEMDGDNGDAAEPVHARWSIDLHIFEPSPRIDPTKNGEPEVLGLAGM